METKAPIKKIKIVKGTTWEFGFRLTADGDPVDMTGVTGWLQFRRVASSPVVMAELKTGGFGMQIGAVGDIAEAPTLNGYMTLTPEQTSELKEYPFIGDLLITWPVTGKTDLLLTLTGDILPIGTRE
jgi:hypothetical protein